MILTQCPVCAAPSLPDLTAKKCSRCKHALLWRRVPEETLEEGGHDKLCKKIKKEAAPNNTMPITNTRRPSRSRPEKCAEDTKGQTCYICTQALHWKTKEGLVRMCSCRGTAGFAHVSCLAEQAKIFVSGGF